MAAIRYRLFLCNLCIGLFGVSKPSRNAKSNHDVTRVRSVMIDVEKVFVVYEKIFDMANCFTYSTGHFLLVYGRITPSFNRIIPIIVGDLASSDNCTLTHTSHPEYVIDCLPETSRNDPKLVRARINTLCISWHLWRSSLSIIIEFESITVVLVKHTLLASVNQAGLSSCVINLCHSHKQSNC